MKQSDQFIKKQSAFKNELISHIHSILTQNGGKLAIDKDQYSLTVGYNIDCECSDDLHDLRINGNTVEAGLNEAEEVDLIDFHENSLIDIIDYFERHRYTPGHESPATPQPEPTDPNQLIITSDCEIIDVYLCPNRTPVAYERKIRELIEIDGMTPDEARNDLLQPIQLELLYQYGLGLFAVESEAVDSTEIYCPYTGIEIPKEED